MSDDHLADDLQTLRAHLELGAPKPPVNPLVRLMGDTPTPMKIVTVVDAQTKQSEVVAVPDLPMAYDLLRKVKYANPRAKARVALKHLTGTAERFKRQR